MSLRNVFRDSWEVWRRKVDVALGGSVEDIKASEVTFDGTTSSLEASNVQDAIDEVVSDIPEIPTGYEASAISYDNTETGLTATDVQSAIDEIVGDIPEIPTGYAASAISYDNTDSGLTAEDAQSAIDELSSDIGDIKSFKEVGRTDGVAGTWVTVINQLYNIYGSMSPEEKITSYIIDATTNTRYDYSTTRQYRATYADSATETRIDEIVIKESDSLFVRATLTASGVSLASIASSTDHVLVMYAYK